VPYSGRRVERLRARRRDRDALAAAAGRGLVGIGEGERRRQVVDLEIHLRAEQEQHRLGVDQELDPLVLDHFVERRGRLGQLHRVGHPGATAVFDPDPQACNGFACRFGQLAHPRRRRVGQTHHLPP
jgi:hypothetical protein